MDTIPAKLLSKLSNGAIKFQMEVIARLKLFDFSRAAIRYYSGAKKTELSGHSFGTFQSRFKLVSFKAGSQIKEIGYKEIVKVGDNLVAGELADSVFILNMSTFERWVLSTMRQAILSNPRKLFPESEKLVKLSYFKKFGNLEEFWEEHVDEYLGGIPYKGMKQMLRVFLKSFDLTESQLTKDIVGKLNENSLCRNLVVHNSKQVNATYVSKAGKFAKFRLGETVTISESLLFEQADNILRFIQDFRKIKGHLTASQTGEI